VHRIDETESLANPTFSQGLLHLSRDVDESAAGGDVEG
jgi:hypothetical protein